MSDPSRAEHRRDISGADGLTMLAGLRRQDVVGESHYQDALSSICGGRTTQGHSLPAVAVLDPEPTNPYDVNAVAVLIEGEKVGHLPRALAAELQRDLIALARTEGKPVGCRATIVGGWNRGRRDRGHFGVRLFFDLPIRRRRMRSGQAQRLPS